MSTLGGLIGVAVGYGSALLVGRIAGWSIAVSPSTTLLALGFAGAVGVFFGLSARRRLSTPSKPCGTSDAGAERR